MKQKNKHQGFHLKRTGIFATLLVAFFIVKLDAGSLPQPLKNTHVLAYATDMSRSGLFSATNAARSANGLAPLTLDSQLNSSAQMKADDMAAKDYWAHVAPDGTQPWYFFDQAGYVYIRAGENLAYGFLTSQNAVDGWMNSPSHRDNVLGNYNDVGFGIANAPNYQQSGQQTIVVAHYGSRAESAPTPAAPVQPNPPAAPTSSPTETTQPAPTDPAPTETTPANTSKPDTRTPPAEAENPTTATQEPKNVQPVQTGQASRASVLGMLAAHNLPLAASMSLGLVLFSIAGYALTHRAAFKHTLVTGEQYAMHHPGVDTAIVAAISSLILLTSYGSMR